MSETIHEAVVIGSGPAGYTAAIYLARAGLHPLVVTGATAPGGQLVNTTLVENYPGFPEGILGPELMDAMQRQAERFGANLVADNVTAVDDAASSVKTVALASGSPLKARTVIIATGSRYRKLGVPGEVEYSGHGVSYCATCDGFFFKDKPIVVVGGGDSAFEEALYLTRFASSVTLIHRRDTFRASAIMVERARANGKLTLLTNTVVTAIHGSKAAPSPGNIAASGLQLMLGNNQPAVGSVSHIDIRNTSTGETGTLNTDAVFVAIGHVPDTEFVRGQVDTDADGYILVNGASTRTSAPGIFAAGDCVDRTYRQAISAAGMGCRAALDAQHYLAAR
ncbi:NAD(P)/FAD-dependent oxidoreductase [Bifidobacterium panos]|uniref:Thioredoxin reductase n=1 Tax=Bifidobacterium panos TaxID=2675321 RepID=A0ABX1SZX9_9BIFI|nr:thioredoxin-disulfide reductase [Bifidobacterium sp. DSM 109963]NMN02717.1 thioredoxin reductase [Bifidobacterium sp. DSM 109963]